MAGFEVERIVIMKKQNDSPEIQSGQKADEPVRNAELHIVPPGDDDASVVRLVAEEAAKEAAKSAPLKIIAEGGEDEAEMVEDDSFLRLSSAGSKLGVAKSGQADVSELFDNDDAVVEMERAWGERRRAVPMGWFVLLALLICGFAGWAAYSVYQAQPEIEAVTLGKDVLLDELEDENQKVHDLLTGMQMCVKSYLAATNVAELLPHVRFPERVEPMMQEYYQSHGRRQIKFRHFEKIYPVSVGGKSFVRVQVELKNGKPYHLLLEQLGDQTFKVDWESDVFYQPVPWRDYCLKRPLKSMDLRVRVSVDDFYGFAFRDPSKYQCYQLTSLGADHFLYGYVEIGTPVAAQIKKLMSAEDESDSRSSGAIAELDLAKVDDASSSSYRLKMDRKEETRKKSRPMILRLRFLREDASTQCVLIESLVVDGWAYTDLPEN